MHPINCGKYFLSLALYALLKAMTTIFIIPIKINALSIDIHMFYIEYRI